MNKVLIIDVSNLFFRSYYAVPSHFTMQDGTPSNAVYGVVSVMLSLLDSYHPTHVFAAQDLRGGTWRHEVYPEYKAGRPEMPSDLVTQLPFVFDFFQYSLNVPLISHEGYEADDVIATIRSDFSQIPETEISILSADQDLLQLVSENVTVLQPQSGGAPPKIMTSQEVEKKLGIPPSLVVDYKSLVGDSSDNLPGVPGIGPVGAKKILLEYGSLTEALKNRESISGKNGNLLREYADQAQQMQKMVTLHHALPLVDYSRDAGKISADMPPNLLPFLEHMGSRNLISRAKRTFSSDQGEQIGMF